MKVSQMPYRRFEEEDYRRAAEEIIAGVRAAKSADEVVSCRDRYNALSDEFSTMYCLSEIRFTLDTRDEFYQAEKDYYDQVLPKLSVIDREYAAAMLESPFRKELEEKLSPVLFASFENTLKASDPRIVEDMQEENALVTEYSKLMSQLTFSYGGKELPLSVLKKYMADKTRAVRRDAYEALGKGLEQAAGALDELFDKLVRVRTRMARKLGYENFIPLGYYRMNRLCYDRDSVAAFRKNVLEEIVPAVSEIKKRLAKKMKIKKFMLYDNDVNVVGGNPEPVLDKDGIFEAAQQMYADLNPETETFFRMMLDGEAFDVESREGKWGGGYCTYLPKYRQPFILANFNGTSGDIDVMTHEVGHALADYMLKDSKLPELGVGGMETAETHSMSMEFFAWKYMDKFFGEKANQYRYMHLVDSFSFIPYGTIVDTYQHIVYEKPELTPAERKAEWNRLEAEYRPWLSTEGMTYLEQGTRWQYQMHIYESPFYYIDYCLAQTVALQFLIASQKDYDEAFGRYLAHVRRGGSMVFTDLVREAGLRSPFEPGALGEMAKGVELLAKLLDESAK